MRVLDQTRLPHEERYVDIESVAAMCEAIRELRVRGAPLLGLCGYWAMAIAAVELGASDEALSSAAREVKATRPTAVDLGAAVDGALAATLGLPVVERAAHLRLLAARHTEAQAATDARIARHGVPLLGAGSGVLTHCNTGALATGGLGTALAVVIEGWHRGLVQRCYATETRPLLQGARLTTWELLKAGVPATLLPDSAVPSLLASGAVKSVITGADRIAANGDTANKVGTFALALAAARHQVPFFIAAPMTTLDFDCVTGAQIPIEFRHDDEVGGFSGQRWAPAGVAAFNPAFDVTPADLVTAIITDQGVARPPYGESLAPMRRLQAEGG